MRFSYRITEQLKQNFEKLAFLAFATGAFLLCVTMSPTAMAQSQDHRMQGIVEEAPIEGAEEAAEDYSESLKEHGPNPETTNSPSIPDNGAANPDGRTTSEDSARQAPEGMQQTKDEAMPKVFLVIAGVVVLSIIAGSIAYLFRNRLFKQRTKNRRK